MRYRISSARTSISSKKRGIFRAKHNRAASTLPDVLPPISHTSNKERIRLDMLFEVSSLPEVSRKNKQKQSLRERSRVFSTFAQRTLSLLKRIPQKSKNTLPTCFWTGTLCAALTVTSICAAVILLALFGGSLAPKTELTVPQFIGKRYEDLEAPHRCEIILNYESSNSFPAGVIIDQTPDGNAKRTLRKGEALRIYLTVSAGKSFYTVEDFTGSDEREALLKLQNLEVAANVAYEYSSSVSSGKVISTTPEKNERLYHGESLVLKVSLGERTHTATMPNLYGLSEAQCAEALKLRGLKLGSVTYKNSPIAQGKTIEQQYPPYSQIDGGTTVNVTISLGEMQTQKLVPDLYGLDLEEAKQKLASVGLILGNIFSVTSGAPQGTVIAQTPVCDTPITPFITSVDVFISS